MLDGIVHPLRLNRYYSALFALLLILNAGGVGTQVTPRCTGRFSIIHEANAFGELAYLLAAFVST